MYRVLNIDYFCTDINQWGSKCISHLHMFRLRGCVFGMELTSILAALLRNHVSSNRGFPFFITYMICCCHYTLLGCLAMCCLF